MNVVIDIGRPNPLFSITYAVMNTMKVTVTNRRCFSITYAVMNIIPMRCKGI